MTRPGWENTCEHGLDLASCSKCQVAAAIAAAEERGRRSGVEERDELRAALKSAAVALNVAIGWLTGLGSLTEAERMRGWHQRAMNALAPRDSVAVCNCGTPAAGRHYGNCASLPPRDSGPVCDAVVSSDPFREWRCGKPKGHEGPHSGDRK